MAERVARVEQQVECLPKLQDDVDKLQKRNDRQDGRDAVLRALVAFVVGSGIIGLVADYLILTQHAAMAVK